MNRYITYISDSSLLFHVAYFAIGFQLFLSSSVMAKINTPFVNGISYIEDQHSVLSFEDLDFSNSSIIYGDRINFSYPQSKIWYRAIINPDLPPGEYLLELSYAPLDSIQFFWLEDGELIESSETGASYDFSTRQIPHRKFLFRFEIDESKTTELIWSIKALTSHSTKVLVHTRESFNSHDVYDLSIQMVYFGMMIVMFIYNAFIFLTLRSRSYFFYLIYIASVTTFLAAQQGIDRQFLWSTDPTILQGVFVACFGLIAWSFMHFTKYYLGLRSPSIIWTIRIMSIVLWSLIGSMAFLSLTMVSKTLNTIAFFVSMWCVLISMIELRRGNKNAGLFLLAFVFMVAGVSGQTLEKAGMISDSFIVSWGMHIGSMIDVTILSFALVRRFHVIQERNLSIQRDAVKKEKESNERIRHSYKQLAKVFYPHQIDQMEAGIELEKTMPTHASEGIVIAFDIIQSSKLHHPRLKDFMESAVHDCMEILNENYDKKDLIANGYRIKELGDGFLCSISYPFQVPSKSSKESLAIQLAERFIASFEKSVLKFSFTHPVFCAIGIAKGDLQGYYPRSGTKEYDLFGKGIVLATRYESIRKRISCLNGGHVVVLQNKIYESLTPAEQKFYQKHQLQTEEFIEEDPKATCLHYQLIPFLETQKKQSA